MSRKKKLIYKDISYVPNGHKRQKLDLYIPDEGGPFPLIIWVHGGGYRMGSKEDYVPFKYLKAGYAIASKNYRLSQHAVFPAQIEDVKAAVRWLRVRAVTYRLDPNLFGAWGSSAGGHLVGMLGTTGNISEFDVGENPEVSSRVQVVVDYFGPADFLQMDTQRLEKGMRHDPVDSPESRLIGGPVQQNKELSAKANPVKYVTPDAPPFLIIHGDQDLLVPFQQSLLLKDALKKAGVPVSFYRVKGGGHGAFKDSKVQELTMAFFNRYLKAGEQKK